MSTALLLNALAMSAASVRFVRQKLVVWPVALPILVVATALSPLGAWVSTGLDRRVLLWLFVAFLLFVAGMMLFYRPGSRASLRTQGPRPLRAQLGYGVGVGGLAGFLGGLLGVGGGNFIVPTMVAMGFDPKQASATTSFIVIFSSLGGFVGHVSISGLEWPLLGATALGSVLGAVVGSYLMTDRLRGPQVKVLIGVVLLGVAGKMIWGLR